MSDQQRNQFDEVVELLVYAPVGLIYEYRTVMPQLVRRGRSQVQLARVFGEMAIKNRQGAVRQQVGEQIKDRACCSCDGEAMAQDPLAALGAAFVRGVTEFGSALGLAPPGGAGSQPTGTTTPREGADTPTGVSEAPEAEPAPGSNDGPLPIAGYDELPAREIISLLSDLDPEQLARIRSHESATRARKTVLAKLDRLEK